MTDAEPGVLAEVFKDDCCNKTEAAPLTRSVVNVSGVIQLEDMNFDTSELGFVERFNLI